MKIQGLIRPWNFLKWDTLGQIKVSPLYRSFTSKWALGHRALYPLFLIRTSEEVYLWDIYCGYRLASYVAVLGRCSSFCNTMPVLLHLLQCWDIFSLHSLTNAEHHTMNNFIDSSLHPISSPLIGIWVALYMPPVVWTNYAISEASHVRFRAQKEASFRCSE